MAAIQELTKGKNYRRNRVKIPGVRFPDRASAIYRTSLNSMISHMSNNVKYAVIPLIEENKSQFIKDADDSDKISAAQLAAEAAAIKKLKQQINILIDDIAAGFINIDMFAAKVARDNANNVNHSHKQSFISTIKRALGIDIDAALQDEGLKTVIDEHIDENISLIKSIPTEYFNRVQKIMNNALEKGTSVGTIKRQLFTEGLDVDQSGALGITKRRAKLIARDQTGKLNGQINKHRQLHVGIEEYIWRDRGDSRVRPLHQELNGKTFSWEGKNRPPEDLDPGQPIQCRCVAEAVVNI